MLLCLSAFFSGSETALMAISRLRLAHLAKTKPIGAKLVERLLRQPERLIGTILLGNNLVNVAMSAIATAFAISLWGQKGIIYVTGILTIAILVFAEITPKVYAKYHNERVSFMTAPLLNVIMIFSRPVVAGVTFFTNGLLLLVGVDVRKMKRPIMTEDEIKTCLKMGWDEGAITAGERKILARVFTLNDRTVGDVMVPKDKITVLDVNTSAEQTKKTIMKTGFTRFPVKEGDDFDVIGFVHAKDLFQFSDDGYPASIKKVIRSPYFVPADKTIDAQLRSFQARKLHQAVVLDSRSHVVGLITLEDIVEELVGGIQDEHD
jgi:Mg2+/Co2+ transporter CorB